MTEESLALMDRCGELHSYAFDDPRLGVLLTVTPDFEQALLSAEYALVEGLSGAVGI
jgi:hypothetical protein